jgi:Tol biopolymer transport system component
MNPDASDAKQITYADGLGATFPVFSPDGSRLAFNQLIEKSQSPAIMDLTKPWAEQILQKLPAPSDLVGSFTVRDWSKDGKKLLISFFEDDGDERGIGVYSFETNSYEKITEEGEYPIWLNDNRRFTYNKDEKIFLADTQTRKISLLYSPPSYQIQQPNISPDNKMIFYRYLQIDSDVWLIDASQNQ